MNVLDPRYESTSKRCGSQSTISFCAKRAQVRCDAAITSVVCKMGAGTRCNSECASKKDMNEPVRPMVPGFISGLSSTEK